LEATTWFTLGTAVLPTTQYAPGCRMVLGGMVKARLLVVESSAMIRQPLMSTGLEVRLKSSTNSLSSVLVSS